MILDLPDLKLMNQEEGLGILMGRFYMAKTQKLHINSGAEIFQDTQQIFNILHNHSIEIQ